MEQNNNTDFSKVVNIETAKLAEETKKIDEYNKKFHPEKIQSEPPAGIPVINIDEKAKNEADIARLCKLFEEKSLKEHNVKKKKIQIDAKKLATIIVVGTTFIASAVAFYKAIENKVNYGIKTNEISAAVEYMDETYMSEVLFNSGFEIIGNDKNGNPIYKFDRSNGLRAVEYLMGKGLTRNAAELLLAEKLNFDQRLYPENMTPDIYYLKQESTKRYMIGENLNEALLIPDGGIKAFTKANQDDLINQVNRIKEEGKTDNARS